MNINLHIERLVLDGLSLAPGERPLLKAGVEMELVRLLTDGGLGEALRSSGAISNTKTTRIQLENGRSPAWLSEQIAGAVYKGISK